VQASKGKSYSNLGEGSARVDDNEGRIELLWAPCRLQTAEHPDKGGWTWLDLGGRVPLEGERIAPLTGSGCTKTK